MRPFAPLCKAPGLFLFLFLFALLALTLAGTGLRPATAQQDAPPKQTLVITYPDSIAIDGSATRYRGIIYVKIYPISPDLVKKYGAGPIASAELIARQRDIRQLPLGEYEIHFSMRSGNDLKTYILRDVILRADRGSAIGVEMNADAKTTIIGGDMTAKQMADTIRDLQSQIDDLKRQVAALKQK